MSDFHPPAGKGRGAGSRPANRFERVRTEDDFEQLEADDERLVAPQDAATEFLPDKTRSLLTRNDSPDVPFTFSANPYRGCEHGCAYCYARPTHELLGMSAGLDFETKILVKHDAAERFRDDLNAPGWRGETIALSGVTDCYQPAERRFRLTRALLEVALEARQALGVVTKNALVLRDLDLLTELAQKNLVHVFLSVTTLDAHLARTLEPRTSSPAARLRTISELRSAGVPVGAMIAPVIPRLTDEELPALLKSVAEAGAMTAGYVLLRLPGAVREVFLDWLARHAPEKKAAVESRIRDVRSGRLNDTQFGRRKRGEGEYARHLQQTFRVFAARFGLDSRLPEVDTTQFRPPRSAAGQMRLF